MQSIKKKLTTVFYQRLRISIDNSTLLKNKKKITNVNDNFHMHFFSCKFQRYKKNFTHRISKQIQNIEIQTKTFKTGSLIQSVHFHTSFLFICHY